MKHETQEILGLFEAKDWTALRYKLGTGQAIIDWFLEVIKEQQVEIDILETRVMLADKDVIEMTLAYQEAKGVNNGN